MRTNRFTNQTLDAIHSVLTQQIDAQQGLKIYAIVDAIFDESMIQHLANFAPWLSLYRRITDAEDQISPLLIALSTDTELLKAQLFHLLRHCNGQPMLSLISSYASTAVLQKHFENYFTVKVAPQQEKYILRYADTRILPVLLDTLNDQQYAEFMQPIYTLCCFDRAVELLFFIGKSTESASDVPLLLSEAQYLQLIDASIADVMLQQLDESLDLSRLDLPPAELYEIIKSYLLELHAENITQHLEQLAYCHEKISVYFLSDQDEVKDA